MAYIIVNENDLQSPIIKFLGEDIAENIIKETNANVGDIVFFSAADYATANKALDAVRQEMGKILKLINPKELRPAWVVDFPMFEKTDENRWTFTHNPFSMPQGGMETLITFKNMLTCLRPILITNQRRFGN